MSVLIVDDEPLARTRLRALVRNLDGYELVAEADSGQKALEKLAQHTVDIVLMDIEMPGMDGLEAAALIAEQATPPALIFVTAYDQYALDAFQTGAQAYLLKPVAKDKLTEALQRVQKSNRAQAVPETNSDGQHDADKSANGNVEVPGSEREFISVSLRGDIRRVAVQDIFFFRAEQKYVVIRYPGGELLTEEPLKALETEFSRLFIRIHRNALVACNAIGELRHGRLGHYRIYLPAIDEELDVSRRHVTTVRKMMRGR